MTKRIFGTSLITNESGTQSWRAGSEWLDIESEEPIFFGRINGNEIWAPPGKYQVKRVMKGDARNPSEFLVRKL